MSTECIWSLIVGILSLCITILIGWQIWSVIQFKQEVVKLRTKFKEMQDESKKEMRIDMDKFKHEAIGISLAQLASILFNSSTRDDREVFRICMNALGSFYESGSNSEYASDAVSHCFKYIISVLKDGYIKLSESNKVDYLRLISTISHPDASELIILITEIETIDEPKISG